MNIILKEDLADGTYVLKYENADGTQTEIGTVKVGTTSYKNWIEEVGYQAGYRLTSQGAEDPVSGTNPTFITDYIPISDQQIIRLKNCYIDSDGIDGSFNSSATTAYYGKSVNSLMVCMCNSSKGVLNTQSWYNLADNYTTDVVKDSDGHITQFKINRSGIAYIRLTLGGDATNAILTIDEEITD